MADSGYLAQNRLMSASLKMSYPRRAHRAFSGEHHLDAVLPREPGEQKHGRRRGPQYRRLGMPDHLLEDAADIVIADHCAHDGGSPGSCHGLLEERLVEGRVGEAHGKGLHARYVCLHEHGYDAGVEPAAQVGSHRDIGTEPQRGRLVENLVEAFHGLGFFLDVMGSPGRERDVPVEERPPSPFLENHALARLSCQMPRRRSGSHSRPEGEDLRHPLGGQPEPAKDGQHGLDLGREDEGIAVGGIVQGGYPEAVPRRTSRRRTVSHRAKANWPSMCANISIPYRS